MALHGFESNDDYDYQLRCLFENRFPCIRCLNIEGESGRRKTAFAWALAHALEVPHVVYHDFSELKPPQPEVVLPPSRDESGKEALPIEQIDNRFADACGFSEADSTVLILDQLQQADFREHIRVYKFLMSGDWELRGAVHQANPRHLCVFLISDNALYHSLQKISFRLWVNSRSSQQIPYVPEDFSFGHDALPLFEALGKVFGELDTSPTHSEYERILRDVVERVRDVEALRCTIYGWTENIERALLWGGALETVLQRVIDELYRYLGYQELELQALEL